MGSKQRSNGQIKRRKNSNFLIYTFEIQAKRNNGDYQLKKLKIFKLTKQKYTGINNRYLEFE